MELLSSDLDAVMVPDLLSHVSDWEGLQNLS